MADAIPTAPAQPRSVPCTNGVSDNCVRVKREEKVSMSEVFTEEMTLPNGEKITIETGRFAKQASGAVTVRSGDTIVLCTATMSGSPKAGLDFFPLTCDYEERKYAVGKIPGGFVKRGGRPGEKSILTSRLIDRPLRPLFDKNMRNETQVIAMPLSADMDHLPMSTPFSARRRR